MLLYVLRRLFSAFLVMFVLSVLVFFMVRMLPGDPTAIFMDASHSDPDLAEQIRQQLGLDRPWYVQYFVWVSGVLQGDFGRSLTQPVSVTDQLALRFPLSLQLGLLATFIGVVLGIPAGIASAVRRGRLFDNLTRGVTFILLSFPAFIIGTILLLINSQTLRLPLLGFVPFEVDPIGHVSKLLLPAFLISLSLASIIARYIRGSLLDTFEQDYIRTARAKGVDARTLVSRHAVRNSIAPVVTIVGVQLAAVVGSTIIMENVFAIPGMGSLLITAINQADYPTVQACVVLIGAIYVVINLIVDLLYPLIDPRIRIRGGND